MLGVFSVQDNGFHPARMNDQKHQEGDRSMPLILKFLLLNGPWDRPSNGMSFQHLVVRNLIDADHPQTLLCQVRGMAITPQHALSPLLERGIPAGRFPITSAMGLQVHRMQNPANGRRTDGRHHPVHDGLLRQVLA